MYRIPVGRKGYIRSACSLHWWTSGSLYTYMSAVNYKSNIWLHIARFGFDKSSEILVRVWQGKLEYLKPNIRIFDIDYPIRHKYLHSSWWPIRFLIFSHKLTFSHSDWSVQTKRGSPLTVMSYLIKKQFFFNRWFHPKIHRNQR